MRRIQRSNVLVIGGLCALALATNPGTAAADAGGASFWLPGIFGSLVAVPGVPGWAYSTIYIHEQLSAGASQNFVLGGRAVGSVVAGLNAHADVDAQGLTYVSPLPVLGGQAAFSVIGAGGNIGLGIDATLTGPRGNTISGSATDNRTTFTDVFYQGTLKWNQGVNNEMVYITGNIPSGTYDPNRLANLSSGYVAVDAGGGYTYFDPKTGHEFSVAAGLTYNGINPDLQYQNGIDFHLEWGASQFIGKNVQIGLVGYFFQQLTPDSGLGAKLGAFEGRTVGVGPQVGFIFPVSDSYQGYLNLKAYKDLAVENRPDGWTAWVTFALSPKAPEPPPAATVSRKY
jgi:hypothetical protein